MIVIYIAPKTREAKQNQRRSCNCLVRYGLQRHKNHPVRRGHMWNDNSSVTFSSGEGASGCCLVGWGGSRKVLLSLHLLGDKAACRLFLCGSRRGDV